jgi:two-component sensor histidine kinase
VFLTALLGWLLFITPIGSLHIANPVDAVSLVLFVVVSLGIVFIIEDLHAAVSELMEANRRLAAAEAEREVMLREAAHRRQNDLQRLIATLRLQAQASRDERVRAALNDATGRVQALARVDMSFERHRNGPATVDTRALLTGMTEDIRQAGSAELRPIAFEVASEAHALPRDQAVPLGLIATELIVNAMKYAFPDDRAGTIQVRFRQEGGHFILTIADDGVGFDPAATPQGTGLGRQLVQALAGQLGGQIEIRRRGPDGGTLCTFRFPSQSPMEQAPMRAEPHRPRAA